MMAVHTSLVEPLPHQIEAVYGHLLPKTPLRFLLADDPGAGKTIMAGLYIREMALRGASRRYLAWKSIWHDASALNLGDTDKAQVKSRLTEAETTLNTRLEEAYRYLLSFHQPDPKAPNLELQAVRLQGSGKPLERAAIRAKNESLVFTEWHPQILWNDLERYGFLTAQEPQGILRLGWLWEALCTYSYLPRLKDAEVLLASVRKGVEAGFFGYAVRLEGGRPQGVLLGEGGFEPSLAGFLLAKRVAERAKAEEEPPSSKPPRVEPLPPEGEAARPTPPPPQPKPRRFYLKKELPPTDLLREADLLAKEIVLQLAKEPGVRVRVVLEVQAEAEDGFPEDLARALRENGQALKAEYGLEEA